MLLDDVFDNLDRERIQLFIRILRNEGMGQSIITAARKEILDGFVEFNIEAFRLIELPLMLENNLAEESVQAE